MSGEVLGTEDGGPTPDGAIERDGGIDGGPGGDAGVPEACEGFPDVSFDRCGSCDDAPGGFYWDGARCVSAGAMQCPCVGAGCDALERYGSEEACETAHAACDARLCETSGGTWEDLIGSCGYACGIERPGLRRRGLDPVPCASPGPACDCGPGRTFEPGTGCVDDPSCSEATVCVASGGRMTDCDAHPSCGALGDGCGPVSFVDDYESCDCGPAMRFDPAEGCVEDTACEASPDEVCEWSGHEMTALCAPTRCGRPSPLACAQPACECGDLEVFDPLRGCVRSVECRDRLLGESCTDDGALGGVCVEGVCCSGRCVAPCYPACGASCDGASGCGDRSFACGDSRTCEGATEYCSVEHPGPSGPSTYDCAELPGGCTECGCLDVPSGCSCRVGVDGNLTVECAFP